MVATPILDAPEKRSLLVVDFTYGDPASPQRARFTDWISGDYTYGGATYSSFPSMAVKVPDYTGGFDEGALEITLPLTSAFIQEITNGEPHSRIDVLCTEHLLTPDTLASPDVLYLFKGRVSRGIRNPQGRVDAARIEAKNWKSKLHIPLSMQCNHLCENTFLQRGCVTSKGGPVGAATETATLTVIDGAKVTLSGLAGHPDRWWHRGYLERQGLRLMIRDWLNGNNFQLVFQPPASWSGAQVSVVPGCDKSIQRCRFWVNEGNFNALGIMMQPNNPIIEDPGE